MDDDGRGEGGRARLARGTKPQALTGHRELASSVPGPVDARGSGPVAAAGGDRPAAQSICEAVEQLIEAKEADEAIAEWMRGGG